MYVSIAAGLGMISALVGTASSVAAQTPNQPIGVAPKPAPPGSVDLGPVPSGQSIQIHVALAPADPTAVSNLLHGLYTPASPTYHHWLAPGQYVARYGPSNTEVTATTSWLHQNSITDIKDTGFSLDVQAPASTISALLSTPFELYRKPSGTIGYRARNAPTVPSYLAHSSIVSIIGLDTLSRLHPSSNNHPQATLQPNTTTTADGLTGCPAAQTAASPGYYTLNQLGQAYNFNYLLQDGLNGHGETVGVYELGAHSQSDTSTYNSCFGLTNTISTVMVDGGSPLISGGTTEADLDIEQLATQSPQANIISYEGPNQTSGAYDTWNSIVTADAAQVISTSWGECEPNAVADGSITAYPALFQQAAAQGQSIFSAAGDSGTEDCYQSTNSVTAETDYPTSDSNITSVGGTSLYGPNNEPVWNSCNTSTTVESTTCANNYGGQAAGGGGQSRNIQRPSYQPNAATWSIAQTCGTTCREVPDISANAGIGMVVYAGGAWIAIGGTSASAPLLAGLVTDRNNGCTTSTGNFNQALYGLAAAHTYGSAFSDITVGNNDMTGSNGGAYNTTTGYDLASGIGSPIAQGLSCPEIITSTPTALIYAQISITGLGLENASISFNNTNATIISETNTQATVEVPPGSGTETISAKSVAGAGTQTMPFTYATPPAGELPAGYQIDAGQCVHSPSGELAFCMQTDGNLVAYDPAGAIWASNTQNQGTFAVMQSDGNFVVYGPSGAVWNSQTSGNPGAYLKVQDNGDIAVYNSSNSQIYHTNTSDANILAQNQTLTPGQSLIASGTPYQVVMQTDGNLVVYGNNGALWNSQTSGDTGAYAVMQGDGNLVVYGPGGAIWNSHTSGNPGAYAIMQGDGNFVVYNSAHVALWAAGS